jgi:hypothetical protein
MAINKNHEFEELNGIKCGIVEKNVSPERVEFLKKILEHNRFTVVVAVSPPPKAAPAPKPVPTVTVDVIAPAAVAVSAEPVPAPPTPQTFTIGVTDYTFNPINALFGRTLKTPEGHVVTPAYWKQEEKSSHDEIPYYEHTKLKTSS